MRVILILGTLLVCCSFFHVSAQCPDSAGVDELFTGKELDSLQDAISVMDSCQTEPLLKAYSLHQLSRLYFDQGNSEAALENAEAALVIREDLLPADDTDVAKTLYMLGVCHRTLGNFTQAEEFLDRSAAIFRPKDATVAMVLVQKELSEVAEGVGDFEKAVELLQNNIDLTQQMEDPIWEADNRVDHSNALLSLGKPSEALATLTLAEALYNNNSNNPGLNPDNLNSCYLNTAYAHDELEQYEKALEYYQKAIRGYGTQHNDYEEAKARANLSLTYIQLGQLRRAEWELGTARNLANRGGFPDVQAQVFDNTGDLLLARKKPLAALEQYHKAVGTLILGWEESLATEFPEASEVVQTAYPEHLLNHLYDKARCLERCFRETEDTIYQQSALTHYYRLADLIDAMRYEHQVQASKLFWRKKTASIYESAVALSYELDDHESGFYFLEKSKSVLLLDAVQQHQARQDFSQEDLNIERELRTRLELLRLELMVVMTVEKRAGLMDSLLRSQQEWESYQRVLKDRYPAYQRAYLGQSHQQPDEWRRMIGGEGWLLVEYMVGAESVYIWSMSADGTTRFRQVPNSDFRPTLQTYLNELNKAIQGGIDPTKYAHASNRLLLQILNPELTAHSEIQELLIIPDGELSFIPFDALLKVPDWDPWKFLVFDYHIRFAYSAEVLAKQREVRQTEGQVLTVAPVFPNNHRDLDELEHSESLIEQLSIRDMNLYLEDEAVLNDFLEEANNAYIINFFTHASANTDEDGPPRIEFYDRPLLLQELYAQQLTADLVILGACETGIGDIQKGEGVMSLSRGVTFAGASSLIASLWIVKEKNTKEMIVSFYQYLQQGHTKSESWWMAKKDFLGSCPPNEQDPFHWAGFAFYGPDYPLEVLPERPWKLWSGIGGGVFVLFLLIWRQRGNGKNEDETSSVSGSSGAM